MNVADEAFNKKNYDKAVEYYNKVLKSKPQSIEALINKGIALSKNAHYDESIAAFDNVINILQDKNLIDKKEKIVLLITGNGLKDTEATKNFLIQN